MVVWGKNVYKIQQVIFLIFQQQSFYFIYNVGSQYVKTILFHWRKCLQYASSIGAAFGRIQHLEKFKIIRYFLVNVNI